MDACERAVELAPDNDAIRDSRGLALVLTGDYAGAIEDFEFYVEWSKENGRYERYGSQREAWIAELEAGLDAAVTTLREGDVGGASQRISIGTKLGHVGAR